MYVQEHGFLYVYLSQVWVSPIFISLTIFQVTFSITEQMN